MKDYRRKKRLRKYRMRVMKSYYHTLTCDMFMKIIQMPEYEILITILYRYLEWSLSVVTNLKQNENLYDTYRIFLFDDARDST